MKRHADIKHDEIGGLIKEDHKPCRTKLIEDTPAENDLLAFHGDIGPHERVAKAIADVIASPEESSGKMIGLEGGWGAGKTTVVNLVRKYLTRNPDISVFSYDAWAHQGDPLRRTFLESLIQHFQAIGENGWINKSDSDKLLDTLAKRRKVSTTRTIPKVTKLGKIFAVAVLLVPVSAPFLTTSLTRGVTFNLSGKPDGFFITGVLCGGSSVYSAFG